MKISIKLPEHLRELLGIKPAPRISLDQAFPAIDDYFDHYENLHHLTDQVFWSAVEDGYIDQARAVNLAAWLEGHPLISALYPYRQLKRALVTVTAPGCWTSDRERSLLRFIAVFCLQKEPGLHNEELLDLPPDLFGDMYEALFDAPEEPIDLSNQYLEVTGPCERGSHKAMIERAIAAGGLYDKNHLRSGYLFVAKEHIQKRVISSKMVFAILTRLRHGPSIHIVSEDCYPFETSGSTRTEAGGYVEGPQRDALRALLYFLNATGQINSKAPEIIAEAYQSLYGIKIISDNAIHNLVEQLEKPSRQAFSRIIGSIQKSGDPLAKSELLRLTEQITSHANEISDATQEALNYMTKRFAKSE